MTIPVPEDLDTALSPRWLTAALRQRFPGVEVRTVTRGPVVERLSTNARFTIDGAGLDGVPQNLCIKGYFGDAGRPICFVGEPEAAFYRDLAEASEVATLRPVYADVDPRTRHGVVITHDEVAAGSRFLDATDGLTVDQVGGALTELARLHASTWMAPEWADAAWLGPRIGLAAQAWGESRTLEIMTSNLLGDNGSGVPPAVNDAGALLAAHRELANAAPTASASEWCVIHGDAHVGNVFLDRDDHPCLTDWQLVQRGFWQLDVGYLIASTMATGLRRDSERDLLCHYVNRLGEFGVATPDVDTGWSLIGEGMVHGMFLWAITTKVAPDVIARMLERLGTAVADHDAIDRLRVTSSKGTR